VFPAKCVTLLPNSFRRNQDSISRSPRTIMKRQVLRRQFANIAALSASVALFACAQAAPQGAVHHKGIVLRVVPQSDLEILDPSWTSGVITQNHGYMIYDTLFGMDANGKISPQMVDTFEKSSDQMIWTFKLRDGLEFRDGKPVTSEDVIASLKRWGQRDTVGQRLLSFVKSWIAVDAKTFRMILKEPYDLVLESLGRPTSYTAFIMPKRMADTPADKQIYDTTGSGPFIFKRDEWQQGSKVVYVKNPRYKPRVEPASGTAGGKVVFVDRVEWIVMKDEQTAANALTSGGVDIVEAPAFEQYSALEHDPKVRLIDFNPRGAQYFLRFNHRYPPFNNPKVRQAAMAALNQSAFLQTQVGIPSRYRTCFSVYPCNTPYFTSTGMDFLAKPNLKYAQQLLKESGYDGAPVILLQPTDQPILVRLPLVAAQLLREAGFRVDLRPVPWQTLLSLRNNPVGWSTYLSAIGTSFMIDPVFNASLSGACDKASPGWPCDSELERLRDAYARAHDEKTRKSLAEQVQVRAMEVGTHVPLGEYVRAIAARETVTGFVTQMGSTNLMIWNVKKQ
jgi:peptide/nickel transport system substrate-binding protein